MRDGEERTAVVEVVVVIQSIAIWTLWFLPARSRRRRHNNSRKSCFCSFKVQ